MKRVKSGAIAIASALTFSVVAVSVQAQEVEVSGNVSLASDYAFRGISQTFEEPAVQGGLDFGGPSGLYAGVWGSTVNFGEDLTIGPRAHMELDVYAGIAPTVAGFDLDVGGLYYAYPGAESDRSYDFFELYGSAGRALGPVGLGVSAAYSPDFFGGSGAGVWYGAEASAGVPGSPITVDGSIGKQSIDDNLTWGTPDYLAWSAGLGAELLGLALGAMVTGTDLSEGDCFGGSDLCNTRVIVSVGRGLGPRPEL
ncbi:MAG: TorF family putative porin, partial [Gemmatimonadota bacterium]